MKTPAPAYGFTSTAVLGGGQWQTWWPLVFTFACFLLARPYEGLVHDARLYVGFAVAPLDPEGIGADLLFREDGQSGRSVYPPHLRALSLLFAPSYAALITTVAGLCLWFAGAWRLCRELWPELPAVAVGGLILTATGIQTYYGGASTFHIAEAFASPRNMAEGLVLLALSFSLRGIAWQSVVCLLIAMVLHPIMAVSGAALVTWWRSRRHGSVGGPSVSPPRPASVSWAHRPRGSKPVPFFRCSKRSGCGYSMDLAPSCFCAIGPA
jgi:hypothetical protein